MWLGFPENGTGTYSGTPSLIWLQSMPSVPLTLKTKPWKRRTLPGAREFVLSSCAVLST